MTVPMPSGDRPPNAVGQSESRFFREPQVLEALTRQALAQRIEAASADDPLRVWVPACAAGEETYTLAICLLERFDAAGRTPRLQIFATDTDDEALSLTRAGDYARAALQGVSGERLARYFEPAGEGRVQVRERVRELLSIGPHDALRDPPIFSRLDLISARNLPAHPAPQAAHRFAASAHFALRAGGWLLLAGQADVGALHERFVPFSDGVPLYRRRVAPAQRRDAHPPAEPEVANAALRDLTIQLRSLREERAVLEAELQHKIRALEESHDDLADLIGTLEATAVFLGPDQRIRRSAGAAEQLLGISAGDLGRSLAALASPLVDAALLEAVRHAAATGAAQHREIRCADQRWYLRRIQPHTATSRADGVVITWVDITPLKALQEEVARVAALEQQRIGQELHDGIQQELTALGLFAKSLNEALTARGAARERRWADRLAEGIGAVSAHVQALARGLVPVPVEADCIAAALTELARSTGESTGVACEFTLEGQVQLPNAYTATHLYRIAQEAVRNATRHAHADRIAIRLSARGDAVRLEVRDNGIGLAPQAGFGGGVGLRLMAHRCALIGATFAAQGEPGGGTRVVCDLPGGGAPA